VDLGDIFFKASFADEFLVGNCHIPRLDEYQMTDEVLGISGFGWFLVRTEGILGPDSVVDILIMVESITMALMNL